MAIRIHQISHYIEHRNEDEVKWWIWKKRKKARQKRRTAGGKKKNLWLSLEEREFGYLLDYHYERCRKGDIDVAFLVYLLAAQDSRCCYCECKLSRSNRVLEHHLPISRGGDNSRDNVAWACWDCNTKKGTKTYDEFMAETGRVDTPGVSVAWSHQGGRSQSSSVVRETEARLPNVPQRLNVAVDPERVDLTLEPESDGAAPARE